VAFAVWCGCRSAPWQMQMQAAGIAAGGGPYGVATQWARRCHSSNWLMWFTCSNRCLLQAGRQFVGAIPSCPHKSRIQLYWPRHVPSLCSAFGVVLLV
jgi:hypothetical protein